MALAEPLHHVIGYMAFYDLDDGIPTQKTTASEATECVSDSSNSENAGVDSVTEHQLSVAIAPLDEFTNVPTVSGVRPRRRQTWRTIVGMAGQPEKRTPGYRYDNPV